MWSAVALAFGLAMDATAVSVVRGLATPRPGEVVILPLLFGGFQAGMAALGWFAGVWLGPYIAAWDHWVAFALLVAIGGKMLVDAWRADDDTVPPPATPALYVGLALATSIDAAAAGLTLPLVPVAPWIALALIGAITAGCAAIGYHVGRFVGRRFGAKLGLLGGLVLIGMGVYLLVQALRAPAETPPVAPPTSTATDAGAQPARVRLPRSADTAVRPTTQPLTGAQLARLAAIEHADFERQDRGATATSVEFRHVTRTRPTLGVTVLIEPCTRCPAMDLAAWQARRDELVQAIPPVLRAHRDTRFEIGARPIAGATAISIYELGAVFATDDHGQPTGDYLDAYVLDYNDGVNRIRVTASYLDDAVGGVDRLLAIAPPEDLEKLAVAFLGFYLHAWP